MNMTIEQLQEKLKSIRERCSGWQKCNDGSYEIALDNAGYNRVSDELHKAIKDAEVGHERLTQSSRDGVGYSNGSYVVIEDELERFAELIRADEREICAKLCEDEAKAKLGLIGLPVVQSEIIQRDRAKQWSLAAEAIRARKEMT